jgi:hypothetical protein
MGANNSERERIKMAEYQTKNNSGTLFKNDRKTEEKHPGAKGKALVGGRWYWVSAWTKDGRDGKFQSLAFDEMTDEQATKYGGHQVAGNGTGPLRQNAGQQSRGGPFAQPAPDLQNSEIPF